MAVRRDPAAGRGVVDEEGDVGAVLAAQEELRPLATGTDPLLVRVGETWTVTSPDDESACKENGASAASVTPRTFRVPAAVSASSR